MFNVQNKYKITTIILAIILIVISSMGLNRFVYAESDAKVDIYQQLNLFGDVLERVRNDYVEEVDDAEVIEAAINGMLQSLDPHSAYLNEKKFKDMRERNRGEFGGLGIQVTMEEGYVKVISPIDDTPAFEAGIQAKDLIVKIDGKEVLGMNINEAVGLMRGKVGTPILLTIVREGVKDPFEVKIIRAIISIQAVEHKIEDDVGYIRIKSFSDNTSEELAKAIDEIKVEIGNEKLKGFIIDLRNNPGGLLDQAIEVSDTFLERGEIVLVRGRYPEETQRSDATKGDLTDGKKVVVLMNGGSASASEIVAGALQDHKRGTIIGTQSFGKGSVQTIIPIHNNGALQLTTARYYTPSGKSIQAKGIKPDFNIEQEVPDDIKDLDLTAGESSLPGHLENEEGMEGSGSSVYVPKEKSDDNQLSFALDFVRGNIDVVAFRKKEEELLKDKEAKNGSKDKDNQN